MTRRSAYRLTHLTQGSLRERSWIAPSAVVASGLFLLAGCRNDPPAASAAPGWDDNGEAVPSAPAAPVVGPSEGTADAGTATATPAGTTGDPSGVQGGSCTCNAPAKNDACSTLDVGVSSADVATAKPAAATICDAKGLELTKLSRTAGDTAAGWLATCCPPAPPPPVAICSWIAIGNGSTCISTADLKVKAAAACIAQNAAVSDFFPANDCPGGATIAKLECCAPEISATK